MISSSSNTNPKVEQLVISAEAAGQRLDNFLFTYLKGVPKTRVYRIIRKGEIRINKGRVKPDYRLVAGDILRVPPVRRDTSKEAPIIPSNHGLAKQLPDSILYEDTGLMVINKPAGIAVHGGSGLSFGVIEALRQNLDPHKTLELVHRLDRDTSGCLMIAKKRSTLKVLHELLRTGGVNKVYWALVQGKWLGGESVALPLKKNQLNSGERIVKVSEDGQAALTKFKVLEEFEEMTLVEARPITGRTHQIRVHAAHVGNPIVGDQKYGDNGFNRAMKAKGFKRLFLHAREIHFKLPEDEKLISIIAPLGPEFQQSLKALSED